MARPSHWLVRSRSPRRRGDKIDSEHVASVARECLFYENVFPHLEGVNAIVPEYYGTYASAAGGWYAIVLGDAGKEMEGTDRGRWPPADEVLLESVR